MSYCHQYHQSVTQALRDRGITPTTQRLRIGEVVLGRRPAHFSAEQLHDQVNDSGARVSRATVYNTLGLFVARGLLREVLVDPGKVFYDSNMAPHHHFYDVESGELTDIDAGDIDISRLPATSDGVEIEGIDVVVRVRRPARA